MVSLHHLSTKSFTPPPPADNHFAGFCKTGRGNFTATSFFRLYPLFFGIPDCWMIDYMVLSGMVLPLCFWTVTRKTSSPSCFMYRKWLPLVLRCVKPFLLRNLTTSRKFQFFILFITFSIRHYRRCVLYHAGISDVDACRGIKGATAFAVFLLSKDVLSNRDCHISSNSLSTSWLSNFGAFNSRASFM